MDNQDNLEQSVNNSESSLKHSYYDLDADLLSKSNALCDLILIAKESPAVVFANAPSEADMIEAILTKNGIKAAKLIGHVPYTKITEAVKQAKDGLVQAVVVTDIASRELDVGAFKALINYSIHEDPEIYLHRYAGLSADSKLEKVISLISPQDFGNFHYLKKIMEFQFEKADLPDKSDFFKEQAAEFIEKAKSSEIAENPKLKVFVEAVIAAGVQDQLLPYLINQVFIAQTPVARSDNRGERAPRDRNDRGDRGNRDGNRGGGDYEDHRGGYENRGGGDYEDRRGGYENRGGGDYEDRRGGYENRDNQGDDRRSNSEEYVPLPELPKYSRIYIGHGTDQGLTKEKLENFITENKAATEILRLNIRETYGFVDVPLDETDNFLDKMATLDLGQDKVIFLRKATNITALKPGNTESSPESQDQQTDSSEAVDQSDEATSAE